MGCWSDSQLLQQGMLLSASLPQDQHSGGCRAPAGLAPGACLPGARDCWQLLLLLLPSSAAGRTPASSCWVQVIWAEGFKQPFMIQKRDGGFGYDTTDLACLRQRVHVRTLPPAWLHALSSAACGKVPALLAPLFCAERVSLRECSLCAC